MFHRKRKPVKPGTFVIKNKGAKRLYATVIQNVNTFAQKGLQTIDDINVLKAVKLPPKEDKREWIAANTVDFFNELTLLYGLCYDDIVAKNYKPGEGFPLNHQYQWSTEQGPVKDLTGSDYCDLVLTWVEDLLDNRNVFPVEDDEPWPEDFISYYMQTVYRRLFRVFNIIYHEHFTCIRTVLHADFHLNTCFKHFIFFAKEFGLLDFQSEEMDSLRSALSNILKHYERACAALEPADRR